MITGDSISVHNSLDEDIHKVAIKTKAKMSKKKVSKNHFSLTLNPVL